MYTQNPSLFTTFHFLDSDSLHVSSSNDVLYEHFSCVVDTTTTMNIPKNVDHNEKVTGSITQIIQ